MGITNFCNKTVFEFAKPLRVLLRWLALALVLAGTVISPALAAKTYSDNGDGTVTDPTTGLQWMRCSMGQTWDGSTSSCTGTAATYTWSQARALTGTVTFAGQSDWRAPNIRELQTIVDRTVYNPALDSSAFPNTASLEFWTTSADASNGTYAWYVSFPFGDANRYEAYTYRSYRVRLVRAGHSFGLLDLARPSTDYVDHGDGTVTHTPTGLMWQRCAVGQSWASGTCSVSVSFFDWATAQLLTSSFAGQSDWRVPSQEELLSLVDYSKYSPAINTTLFPNTPASNFWSASANAGSSDFAWAVNFSIGPTYGGNKSGSWQVRLVRAGQSFGSFALNVAKTGVGTVGSSALAGIDCGTVCTGSYTEGTRVILHATPIANLISWGGVCLSAGTAATCTVTMDAIKDVSASFVDIPVISGLPATLTFAAQNIGSTSAVQHATLTNSGTADLQVSNIAATGDYSVTHNCLPGPQAAGASCTLSISFTPSASGTRTGSVTVNSNAPGSAPSITLSGTGLGGVFSLSTSALYFYGQNTGTISAAQTVTLNNIGGAAINNISSVANGDFAISASTCGATLTQGTSCSVSVTFSPLTAGAHVSSLVISSDAANNPHTVSLGGTGIAVPGVALSPGALNFAAQRQGTSSSPQTVTLTNTGTAKLNLTSVLSSNADFALTHNCGTGPEAGAACTVNVTFNPSATGNRTGTLGVTSNASGSVPVVSLTGIGTSALAPLCSLSAVPAKVRKGDSSTLTASCNPAAISYVWTGGNCASNTTNTCVETPSATTAYSVMGSNSYGYDTATATVTVKSVDLTPILMLLLD